MLIINKDDILSTISMDKVINRMRKAFVNLNAGKTFMPDRMVMKLNNNSLALFMPAYLHSEGSLGIKVSSIFPSNKVHGLPLIHAQIILMDDKTGKIKALIEGSVLTAIRTAAVSALVTDLLSPRNSTSLSIIGSGMQASYHIKAMCCVRDIKKLYIFSRNKKTAFQIKDRIKQIPSNIEEVYVCDSSHEAVRNADIICTTTSTNSNLPIVKKHYIRPGTHINAIGGVTPDTCEVDASVLEGSYIVVEQFKVALQEAGEIRLALKMKYITSDNIVEIGSIIDNDMTEKPNSGQTTFFKSVGIAMEDIAAAELIYQEIISCMGNAAV